MTTALFENLVFACSCQKVRDGFGIYVGVVIGLNCPEHKPGQVISFADLGVVDVSGLAEVRLRRPEPLCRWCAMINKARDDGSILVLKATTLMAGAPCCQRCSDTMYRLAKNLKGPEIEE